jgi:predicted SnoaL-like aldol condensation-catalyzing enzyme
VKLTGLIVACGVAGVVAAATPALAQRAQVTPQEEANKKVVYEFYRQVWETGNADLLPNFYAADFIEHNPAVPPGGLDGLAAFLKRRFPQPRPAAAELREPPAVITVDGDIVTWIFRREQKDARGAYDSYWFDSFRIRDGKVVEHWDAATRPAAPPAR